MTDVFDGKNIGEEKDGEGKWTFFHPRTKEPLFTVTKEWGRAVSMDWHPYMKETHGVHLTAAFGKDMVSQGRFGNTDEKTSIDSGRGDAKYVATRVYAKAQAGNFKDKFKIQTGKTAPIYDANNPWEDGSPRTVREAKHYMRILDPETNEVIAHDHPDEPGTKHPGKEYGDSIKYNPHYLKAHDIDETAVRNLQGRPRRREATRGQQGYSYNDSLSAYELADKIHDLKGKPTKAVGVTSLGAATVYKLKTGSQEVLPGLKQADIAAAEKWKNDKPAFGREYHVQDHGPHGYSIFGTSTAGGNYETNYFHRSAHVSGEHLIHANHSGAGKPTTEKID